MRPLVLTAVFDRPAQAWLQGLRNAHFPPERNVVPAHLTLFHALPGSEVDAVHAALADECTGRCQCSATFLSWRLTGQGVALDISSPDHVLNNIVQRSRGLVLLLCRGELQRGSRRAQAASEVPLSRSRCDEPGEDGGGHGPAAQGGPAAQPGGELRAAAKPPGRACECLPAPVAIAVAFDPTCFEVGHEGGDK